MTTMTAAELFSKDRRRILIRGLVIALLTTVILVLVYFLAPLDDLGFLPIWVAPVAAPLILAAVSAWQVSAIVRSPQPGIRAIEALALIAPLYLLLFASAYFVISQTDSGNFSPDDLTRVDTLYFTVTIFSTVGFGDISAASQVARIVVTVQMLVNLVVLGAGVRLLIGAVKRGRQAHSGDVGGS